ncbi:hypothetical protein HPB49_001858 [Dermacentor silvarum]|uniref:Uncharacterized protein n=1 Tax=Dermacentor silvarum TaxID=543639 RepID=A0ACB8DSL6_DERSI|nr:hypothetical protein HPB49_001858 [Dermacentor silvarum]
MLEHSSLSGTVCAVATAVHTEALPHRTAAFVKRTFSTQTERTLSSSTFVDRRKQRAKEKALRLQIVRLQQTVDSYKEQLRKLKEDCNVSAFVDVVADAHQNKANAVFIVDQVINYGRKRPTWSETTVRYCVILRNLSTKAYEYVRTEHLCLPCRNTLQKYIGSATGEIGFSPLVRCRLKTELQGLTASQSKVCSLVVDEMHIKQKLEYNKQRDAFVGDVNMSIDLEHLIPSDSDQLTNSLLCFLLCGLSTRFKIPVGYFFTKACTGAELAQTIRHVVKKTEELGFEIVRLVTDNHKTNVAAMDILSKGTAKISAPHPADPSRLLYLAFDQSHIIKNVRSQFLAKDIGGKKEISSAPLKELYRMQRGSTVKPIRYLTRKHLYPSNIEKMSVRHAVQIFSPPVTAALRYLKDQAGHTSDLEFRSVGPTVEFMSVMHKWFTLINVSNTEQHIHRNDPGSRHFSDVDDMRLQWLETDFLDYIEKLRKESRPDQ